MKLRSKVISFSSYKDKKINRKIYLIEAIKGIANNFKGNDIKSVEKTYNYI